VGRASQGGRQLGGNATGCQPCTGVPARAWHWRSIDVIRAAGLHAGGRFQVRSRCRLLVVVKMSIQVSAERFCRAPPRTSKCMAPASRRMQAAAQADLGSLGCSLTRCFPLEELPYHRGERGRVYSRVPRLRGATKHTGASRAVDEGSGWSCAAVRQRTSQARTSAASATSKGPMNGSIWNGITASGAVRLSKEPAAGAGHDR